MRTTKKDFDLFRKECRYWIDFFGLKDWQVHFRHEVVEDGRAETAVDVPGRIAIVTLSAEYHDWTDRNTVQEDIKRTAFHEVCEILLGRLGVLACSRAVFEEAVNSEIHAVIRRLENSVYEELK